MGLSSMLWTRLILIIANVRGRIELPSEWVSGLGTICLFPWLQNADCGIFIKLYVGWIPQLFLISRIIMLTNKLRIVLIRLCIFLCLIMLLEFWSVVLSLLRPSLRVCASPLQLLT